MSEEAVIEMNEEEYAAVSEYIHALQQFQLNPGPGTHYALEMASAELELLGIDPADLISGDD